MNVERLKKLASGLRVLAPIQFNFTSLYDCALGHSTRIFPDIGQKVWFGFLFAEDFFDLPIEEIDWLFNNQDEYPVPDEDVTAAMVADRIEALIAYSGG